MGDPARDIAYSFLHQKLQVYAHSTMDWQRDDIEVAVGCYAEQMNRTLYNSLANGREDYLLSHEHFEADLRHAVECLER